MMERADDIRRKSVSGQGTGPEPYTCVSCPPCRLSKSRWFQFGVRTFLLSVLIVAVPMSWLGVKRDQGRQRRHAAQSLAKSGFYIQSPQWKAPAWLQTILGDDFSFDVEQAQWFERVSGSCRYFNGACCHGSDGDLVPLSQLPNLRRVAVPETTTDAGLKHLEGLTDLRMLDLSCTRITGDGLMYLDQMTKLNHLFLGGTGITDTGLAHLERLTGVNWLILSQTRITDAGLAHLKGMVNLEKLDLRETQVTDVGLEHLQELANLKRLNLDGTRTTDEGVKRLQQVLPRCEITNRRVFRWQPAATLLVSGYGQHTFSQVGGQSVAAEESAGRGQRDTVATTCEDDPAARMLYDEMIKAMWKAESLSYVVRCKRELRGRVLGDCAYRVWLKKPNYFRVELQSNNPRETGGTVLGDGATAWVHWPEGRRPRYFFDAGADEESQHGVYMKWPDPPLLPFLPPIRYLVANLQAERSLPILDPNIFHLGPDTVEGLGGFSRIGTEKLGDELCDKIEVRFDGNLQTWHLCLSQSDHLPRKLKEVVRFFHNRVNEEEWLSVRVNAPIPETMFAWNPPEDWKHWRLPTGEERFLAPGTIAPEFDLASADGTPIRLSNYRGQVVWLYSWSTGCPACRKGMARLSTLYSQFKDEGLVILGFNCMDDKDVALNTLREYGATFPNVLDSSDAAVEVYRKAYGGMGVPLNYVIDRDGKVVDVWYGYREQDPRPMEALMKTGGELEDAVRRTHAPP